MRLLDAIAQSVGVALSEAVPVSTEASRSLLADKRPTDKPVLQLNPFPISLETHLYENARSDSNPNGDMKPLFAFRELVDPVPKFDQFYSPGGSTEAIYENILLGASMAEDSAYTAQVFANARRQFQEVSFARMDGTPGVWRPVYAVPGNWYDASLDTHFKDVEIDLQTASGQAAPCITIGAASDLQLAVDDHGVRLLPIDNSTTIRSVRMKCLLVQFRRPWFNPLLFESGGWYLSQQAEGFCSSGDASENQGVIPLLPTGMLITKDVAITAEWSQRDRALLESAETSGTPLSLGPFTLNRDRHAPGLEVLGWISSLVPYSPKASDLRGGSVLVRNNGAFIARFAVRWQHSGQPSTSASGNIPALGAKSIDIPAGVRDVTITIDVMTFPEPIETWKTVRTYDIGVPVKKCYEISGVTWNVKVADVSDAQR